MEENVKILNEGSGAYEIGVIFGEEEVKMLIKNAGVLKKARVHREKTSNLTLRLKLMKKDD